MKKALIVLVILLLILIVIIGFALNPNRSSGVTDGPVTFDKPIIYIYPEEELDITVTLGREEAITCSYPKYDKGWSVTAFPDGTLTDTDGNKYYSLYWEGEIERNGDFSDGFVVKGEDAAQFLEQKLKILGLNYREAQEFIVYWLPELEKNEYNLIRFMTREEIDKIMPLEFSVTPDSIIRVMMEFKAIDKPVKVTKQQLSSAQRHGFTVVEWGGTEY